MDQGQGLYHVLQESKQLKGFSPKKPLAGFKQGTLSFVILNVYSGYWVDYLKKILQYRHFIINSASKEGRKDGLLRGAIFVQVSQNIIILF